MAGQACFQDYNISKLSQTILESYRHILNPESLPQERDEHQKVIEDFRNSSPYCVHCGLFLAEQQEDYLGVHLGLQLVEHFVRFRWNSLVPSEQLQLIQKLVLYKNNVGSSDINLPGYIKEGVARILVEVAKKTWPQHWSTFISDIFSVEDQLPQMEMILLIFRRLAEDLLSYDSALSNQRKSVMLTSLKEEAVLSPLFQLIVTVLESGSSILYEVAISTLSAFVEWVDLQFLTFNNCHLLLLLLNLLCNSHNLRLLTCDCLTDILSRKGAMKTSRHHRELFLQLLSKDVLDELQRCTSAACELSANDEVEYMFLKKLCQMMVQLGSCQLLPLWESSSFSPPEHLGQYLHIMLIFLHHPSQVVSSTSLEFWNGVLHHQYLNTHPVLMLPELLQVLREKQLKVGDPTLPVHASSHFSKIDFDGPEEYNVFFSKCKGLVNRLLTDMVSLIPAVFIQETFLAVQQLITKEEQPQNEVGGAKMSPLFLEWDATISFLECWVAGLSQNQALLQEAAPTGVAILHALLSYCPTQVTSVFCHLKALEGGLQTFVVFDEEKLLQIYLEKILTYVIYPGADTSKITLSRDQKQARLNSLYALINIVKSYAKSLLPATELLLDHYSKLVSSDLLLYSEKCMFIEAFTILSHFRSASEQDVLLEQLLNEVKSLVSSLKSSISSLSTLIQYLSLGKDISDPIFQKSSSESAHLCRAQLCYCAHTIMSVLQRSSPRLKRQCGITVDVEIEGVTTPSYRHIVPLLMEFILPLIKTFHLLWSDTSRPLLSQYFQHIHSLHQHDRDAILGISSSGTTEQDELGQVQQQLMIAYDRCVMAVGFAWATYGPDSLSEVGFVEGVITNVFTYLADTSQLRIKSVIRNLITPMVETCPPNHWQISLTPPLIHLCYITFNRLQNNWSNIIQQRAQRVDDDEEQESLTEQVLIHQFTVNLTRQYIQLIETVCLKKEAGGNEGSEEMQAVAMATKDRGKKTDVLSDLALCLLCNTDMQTIILQSVFAPMGWLDGSSVRRCINIATAIFEKVSIIEFGEAFVCQSMEQVLMGLQVHGEDGGLCVSLIGLALQLYETTAPCVPAVCELFASLPECSAEKVKSFNHIIQMLSSSDNSQAKHIKRKRDEFRKLLSGIIGKPLGQLHKGPPVFLDLPSLAIKKDQRLREKKALPLEGLTELFGEQDL